MEKNNFKYSTNNYYNLRNISKYYNLEVYEFISYCLIIFILPFIIAHPQWLIGILVNFFLIRSAIYFKFKYVLPIILLPSLGVLAAGIIFGTNTHFLLYFIPMIWFSNLIYILSFKFLKFKKNVSIWVTPLVSSLLKSGLLFGYACILVYLFNFPIVFLVAMGSMQLITSIVGGYLAVTSSKLI